MLKTSYPYYTGRVLGRTQCFPLLKSLPRQPSGSTWSWVPSGRGTHIDLLGPRPEAGGKVSPPSVFSCLFKTSRVLGRRKAQVKKWDCLSLILLVPALFSSRNDFSLAYLCNPTITQGLGLKKKRCPAQCWSHWTSYHLSHHLSPQPCVTV